MIKLISGSFEVGVESAIETIDVYNKKHTLNVDINNKSLDVNLKEIIEDFKQNKGIELIITDGNSDIYKYSNFSLMKASSSFFDFESKKHTLIFDIEY
jgi:hypothetical protein